MYVGISVSKYKKQKNYSIHLQFYFISNENLCIRFGHFRIK